MKNLFNKYCDFIGVENEGNRRLLIIIIIFCYFYIIYFITDNFTGSEFGLKGDIEEFIFIFTVPLILSFFSVGFVTKTFNWVKQGFNK